MDLTLPLADLAGSTVAKLLQHLSRVAAPMTGRRLSAMAGVAAASGAIALSELAEIGLVRRREAGRAYLYELNRDHVLWGPVEVMLNAPRLVERRIGEMVRSAAGDSTTALLFGSFARRDGSRTSDIDIAIVWGESVSAQVREELPFEIRASVADMTGNQVQILALDDELLGLMLGDGDPLLDSFHADAVTVAGPDLATRLRVVVS